MNISTESNENPSADFSQTCHHGAAANEALSFAQREQKTRLWIANKESVCPYAMGLARFVHLPEITAISLDNVRYLAGELKSFYKDKQGAERVGRWILLPHREWTDHQDALAYSELMYWQLLAAYYYLNSDPRKMKQAMSRQFDGIALGDKGEICNPIVGKFARSNSTVPHFKSLFCTALGPTYRSKKFYRYMPSACIVMVYAQELMEKKDAHPKTMHHISLDMMLGNLAEVLGDDLAITRDELAKELPMWRVLIQNSLQLAGLAGAACTSSVAQEGLSAQTMAKFRDCSSSLVDSLCYPRLAQLPVLQKIMSMKRVTPHQILKSHFSGAGLYTYPDYLTGS